MTAAAKPCEPRHSTPANDTELPIGGEPGTSARTSCRAWGSGAMIIIVGVGLFGTLTGFLANAFLAPQKPKAPDDEATEASEA